MVDAGLSEVLRRWTPDDHAALGVSPPRRVAVTVADGSDESVVARALARRGIDVVHGPPSGPVAAALVVIDSDASPGRTELATLRAAATTAPWVACVATGRSGVPDARVLARIAGMVATHCSDLGPVEVLPVGPSEHDTVRVAAPGVAAELDVASGLGDVVAWVDDALARPGPAAPRRVAPVLARARGTIERELARLRVDDTADLRAERERLSLHAAEPTVDTDAGAELEHHRIALLHGIGARVRAASTSLRATADRSGPGAVRRVGPAVLGRVYAETGDDVQARLGGGRIVPSGPLPRHDWGLRAPRSGHEAVTVVLGASAGFGVGRVLAAAAGALGVGLPTALSVVLSALVGVVTAWWFVRVRRRTADRDVVLRVVADELADVRSELEGVVLARVVEARARLDASANARRREVVARARKRLSLLDETIRRRTGERAARIEACRRDLAVVTRAADPGGRDAG